MRKSAIIAGLMIMSWAGTSFGQKKSAAEMLGYPADAKLLMIHADDLALGHGVDQASFAALEKRAVTTASIMVPCPWFTEVAAYAKAHPDADLGLHITLTSEWKSYRWGPIASKRDVAGLLDPAGYLWPENPPVVKNAKAEEVEVEIRAQIETALKAGIHPTHIDSHMGTVFNPAFFAAYVKVAREFGLPFFALPVMTNAPSMAAAIKPDDVFPDGILMASPAVKADQWLEYYVGIVKSLKPGLTEVIVHMGKDDAELQAITEGHPDFGSAWRQRDFDVLTSPEFRRALDDNHVILVGWKEIKNHRK